MRVTTGTSISNQLLVGTVICLSRSSDAKVTVENEQERVTAEITAFERFATQLKQLEITDKDNQMPVNTQLYKQPQSSSIEIKSVREYYEQTVMATDHYTEDYDESFSDNIRIEFGPEYAAALDTNDYLTSTLKQSLLQATREVIRKRADFLSTLQSEYQSITDAQHRLDTGHNIFQNDEQKIIENCSLQDLKSIKDKVQSIRHESEAILKDRQKFIHNHPKRDLVALQEYLYFDYEWNYPVLSDVLEILTIIQDIEYELINKMAKYEQTN
jgi:leucyl-tRNA synthetase